LIADLIADDLFQQI